FQFDEDLAGRKTHAETVAISEDRMKVTDSEDRKSTRLNSSHVKTSYAVFCLKKKNLALSVLASAGVYVGGGIAPRIVAHLRKGAFLRAFRDKGRMSGYLARVPLHVIVNPHVALLGAAAVAARLP